MEVEKKKDFKCKCCCETFTRSADMYRHKKRCGKKPHVECPYCPGKFSRKDARDRHVRRKHPKMPKPACFECKKCGEKFNWKEVLQRHLDFCGVEKDKKFKCTWSGCTISFTRKQALEDHIKYDHKKQQDGKGLKRSASYMEEEPAEKKARTVLPDEEKTALGGTHIKSTFLPQSKEERQDLPIFFKDKIQRMKQRLEFAIKERYGVKWNLSVIVQLKQLSSYTQEERRVTPSFRAGPYTATYPEELEEQLHIAGDTIEVVHAERVSHYQRYRNELNFNGIEFPVNREGIKKFERLNPSISITVIGYERGKEFPYYIPDVKKEKHVTFLYWSEEKKSHYAWIKNLNRFLSNQTKHKTEMFYCERCFHGFIREDLLKRHEELCAKQPVQKTVMTDEGVKFRNIRNMEPSLFTVYADFEAIVPATQEMKTTKTETLQIHEACGYAYTVVSRDPDYPNHTNYYRGEDAVEKFLEEMV